MGRKKNSESVKWNGENAVYRSIQQSTVTIDGYGIGLLCLRGCFIGDDAPEMFTIEFGVEGGAVHQLRCFDRFMDAWRSYRRFVCLSKEGGRQ